MQPPHARSDIMNKTLEEMMIELCAPTLAGVKPANLFRCPDSPELYHSVYEWNNQLRASGIRIRVVKRCRKTHACLIYVCRWDWICRVIAQKDTGRFLKQNGYDLSQGTESVICQLSRRLCVQQDFPHEIGVFLGYPLRDVIGFIQNKGKNYSYSGCWKSYGDPNEAQKQFDTYKRCTACYKRMYRRGVPLMKMVVAA